MTTGEETKKEDEEDEEDVEDEEDRMGGRYDLDSWLKDVGHFNCSRCTRCSLTLNSQRNHVILK